MMRAEMRCDTARGMLHDWFDTQGAAALPTDIGDHVRRCGDCRVLIARWNAIELGLQALRQDAPSTCPDFTRTVRARIDAPLAAIHKAHAASRWRLALAGAGAALAAAILAYVFGISRMLPAHNGASSFALVRPADPGHGAQALPGGHIVPNDSLANMNR